MTQRKGASGPRTPIWAIEQTVDVSGGETVVLEGNTDILYLNAPSGISSDVTVEFGNSNPGREVIIKGTGALVGGDILGSFPAGISFEDAANILIEDDLEVNKASTIKLNGLIWRTLSQYNGFIIP